MAASQAKLFGTNGIRFVPGEEHGLDFVIKAAEAIGTYFSDGEILVGRDGRLSGQAMHAAASAGLMSSGRDVADAGLVPTPALQFAVNALGYRGGVMVTASHNPPRYNGLKVMGSNGIEIPRAEEQKIEKISLEGAERRANWRDCGVSRGEPSVIRTYLNELVSQVDAKKIAERKFKVIMDPGNGAQCVAAPYLLDSFDCNLITINSLIDGEFPGRGPEPTPDTLHDLAASVKATGADLGVAYDGDGDRSIFCDEQGNVLWGDQTGSLLADYLLERNRGGIVVTAISSSQAVEAVAKKRGGSVIRTRVGSVDVSNTILEKNAYLGFEENGGFIYPKHLAIRDGGMTTALILECLASRGGAFSKVLADAVPKFYQAKTKVEIEPRKVPQIMKAVERHADERTDRTDGLKIWTDEHSWVLARPSGTEPIIRIFSESDTQEKADSVLKKFTEIVKESSR